MNRIAKILTMAALLVPVPLFTARAADVTLTPAAQTVAPGDTFSVALIVALSQGEALAGGVIDLGYDDTVVEILQVVIDEYWDFMPDPGEKNTADDGGLWEGIGFDAFENDPATESALIATIGLKALAAGTSGLEVLSSSQFYSASERIFPALYPASIRVNTPPVADEQTLETAEDAPIAVTLSGTDAEGDSLVFTVLTGPPNGVLGGAAPNLTYTPAADFNGTDSFTYMASDPDADSGAATVTITVSAVNDAPAAGDVAVAAVEDTPAAVALAGSDVDGDSLVFTVLAPPSNGVLGGTAPNLTYSPGADFNGTDSFTYKTSDGALDSNPATVTITVSAVNDAPTADPLSLNTDEDTPAGITLAGSDVDGDSITFAVVAPPVSGTLSGTAPNLTYNPGADFNGTDSFTYKTSDGALDSNPATVIITVSAVNDAPTAGDLLVSTDEDVPVSITLAGSDVDGDTMTYTVLTTPSSGALSGEAPSLIYTPAENYNGEDGFTYSVSDGQSGSGTATVTITVSAVNDAPTANAGSDQIVIVGTTVTLDGSASSDSDGDALLFNWALVAAPDASAASFDDPNAASPAFVPDQPGLYVARLIVNDGTADSAPASVTIFAEFDSDNDGISESLDNCTVVFNPDQRDTDADGYGNLCDGDLNNDGDTNTLDLQLYKLAHRSYLGDPNYDADADFDGDEAINTLDLNIYKGLHRLPPGPSCCGD